MQIHLLSRRTIAGLLLLLAACGPRSSPEDVTRSEADRATDEHPSSSGAAVDEQRAPAADRFTREREHMVEVQIVAPRDGRPPVRDATVLDAMRAVPRQAFVPEHLTRWAYADSPLPIGENQTISQPYIVALITEQLRVTRESKVLEVGSGCGYQAAVLAEITPHVFGIEILEPLYERSRAILLEQGYTTVRLRLGDGYHGWPEHAPFDGIIVSCAAERIPEPLWNQLRIGGRIVIPVGHPDGYQELVVVTKEPDGSQRRRVVTAVRFVPMTGTAADER